MARARVVFFVWSAFLILALPNVAHAVGINWGSQVTHYITPNITAQMLKDNGITRVKFFEADPRVVCSLAGSNIEVMLGIPNFMLESMTVYANAKAWVRENVTVHMHPGGVNIKFVGVGNEPFLKAYKDQFTETLFPALKNIQKALNEAGYVDKIKATVPFNSDVYETKEPNWLPSDGDFRADVKQKMMDITKFLQHNNAPFVVNIYPFFVVYLIPEFDSRFAFFDGGDSVGYVDENTGKAYRNMMDAQHDALVSTLEKNGFGDVNITIGEVGWPTDGAAFANVSSAKRFYDGLMKKLAANEGTPLRPGPMDVYLFGLFDEDAKSVEPGNFERHWGIFNFDGTPKFPIDLSGKGDGPIPAKGVQSLKNQWCVFKDGAAAAKNLTAVQLAHEYACDFSDCTSTNPVGSCGKLDLAANVSYAFNAYFQAQDQNPAACSFNGLAEIVTKNASLNDCLFPIQIQKADLDSISVYGKKVTRKNTEDDNGNDDGNSGEESSAGEKLRFGHAMGVLAVLFVGLGWILLRG